uniref:KIB1-4 beta-propeller domain-containing protein n=1 Tax=Leersia perrieri TaxID=77586 RepID=A0A0D9VCF6_9ORYZ
MSLLKLVLSPAGDVAAAVIGEGRHGKFAVCRPGAAAWTVNGGEGWRRIKDMVFHNGKLYAVDHNEDLLAVDVTLAAAGDGDGEPPGVDAFLRVTLLYLVDVDDDSGGDGDLLLVRREVLRSRSGSPEIQDRFAVFKADFGSSRWRQVRTVGDDSGNRTLFVGRCASPATGGRSIMSSSSRTAPATSGIPGSSDVLSKGAASGG